MKNFEIKTIIKEAINEYFSPTHLYREIVKSYFTDYDQCFDEFKVDFNHDNFETAKKYFKTRIDAIMKGMDPSYKKEEIRVEKISDTKYRIHYTDDQGDKCFDEYTLLEVPRAKSSLELSSEQLEKEKEFWSNHSWENSFHYGFNTLPRDKKHPLANYYNKATKDLQLDLTDIDEDEDNMIYYGCVYDAYEPVNGMTYVGTCPLHEEAEFMDDLTLQLFDNLLKNNSVPDSFYVRAIKNFLYDHITDEGYPF